MPWNFDLQNREVPLLESESWIAFCLLKTEERASTSLTVEASFLLCAFIKFYSYL